MFFKDNPFYLLGVHTTDSGDRLEEALRDKLHAASEKAERDRLWDAAYVLQKSVKRSGAEFFWLPELSREEAWGLVEKVTDARALSPSDFLSLSPLSRVVLAMNGLFYGCDSSRLFLQEICANYDHIYPAEVTALFNAARRKAHLPVLRNGSHVEMWKRELPGELLEAVHRMVKGRKLSDWARLLGDLGKEKDTFPWRLFVMDYEEMSRKDREELERNLDYALCLTDRHFPQGLLLAGDTLKAIKDLALPLSIRSGCWPLETAFQRVRKEMITLWDKGRKDDSRALGETLFPFFTPWPEFQERAEKDREDMKEGRRPEEAPSSRGLSWQSVPAALGRIPEVKEEKEKKYPLFLLFLAFFIVMTLVYVFVED